MAPESMVYALRVIHSLLNPDGMLVDIHPLENPRPITVRLGNELHRAGWLQDANDYVEYIQATEAIDQAVTEGWFLRQWQGTFDYMYHADTIFDLRDYLNENSKDAVLDELVIMRADDLMRVVEPDKEVLMRVPVSISSLLPLCQGWSDEEIKRVEDLHHTR